MRNDMMIWIEKKKKNQEKKKKSSQIFFFFSQKNSSKTSWTNNFPFQNNSKYIKLNPNNTFIIDNFNLIEEKATKNIAKKKKKIWGGKQKKKKKLKQKGEKISSK